LTGLQQAALSAVAGYGIGIAVAFAASRASLGDGRRLRRATVCGRVIRIGGMLGRKNVRTDEPSERVDTKILETLVELDAGTSLPIGLRVDAFIGSAPAR
jgi:hypothetical protein